MNTKNQTNLIVIGKYERLKKKKKETFRGGMPYQNVLLYTYLLHKPTLTHT